MSNIYSISSFILQVNKLIDIEDVDAKTRRDVSRIHHQEHNFLCWFILKERRNIKGRLLTMGVNGVEDDLCIFCKEEVESFVHIFFYFQDFQQVLL